MSIVFILTIYFYSIYLYYFRHREVLMTGIPFSLFFTAPMVACLGGKVALFSRPFEARPTDSVRREVFRQQSKAATSWFSPDAVPAAGTPLGPVYQRPAGPLPRAK